MGVPYQLDSTLRHLLQTSAPHFNYARCGENILNFIDTKRRHMLIQSILLSKDPLPEHYAPFSSQVLRVDVFRLMSVTI